MGFDISQERTGWCVMSEGKLISWGNIKCPDMFKKTSFKTTNFSNWLNWYMLQVRGLVQTHKPEYVAMEDLNVRYVNTAKILLQFQAAGKIGIMQADPKIMLHMYNNITVKSNMGVITRKSKIDKDIVDRAKLYGQKAVKIQMVDIINDKYDTEFTYEENDEADAIALAETLFDKWRDNHGVL